jgi:hypothetical protein
MKDKRIFRLLPAALLCMGLLGAALPAGAQAGTDTAQTEAAAEAQAQPAQSEQTDLSETEAVDGGAEAQTEMQSTGATAGQELAQAVLASDPADAADPAVTPPEEPETPYTKVFPFSEDQLFSGVYKSYGFYFNVEDYWQTSYAYARIEFSVSPLIEDVPASLTFSLNSVPVYSCKVDYRAGKTQTAYVELPVAELKQGYNVLSLTGYVRLYDEEGCLDDFSGANWVNVSKNSLVQVGYAVTDTQNALCYYPYPFASTMDDTGADCAVYVPKNAANEELAAALLVRADLGGETDGEDDIALKTLDAYGTDGRDRRVVVALRANLPAQLAAAVGDGDFSAQACVLETTEGNATVLVITSDNAAALYEGAAMLLDENRVTQEKTDRAVVAAGTASQTVQNASLSDLTVSGQTITSITGGGLEFIGPFRQEQEVFLPLDGGFVLAEGGKISLNFRYSDNLDFDRSLITVYWGSVPVSSKKLEAEKAGGDTLSFVLPADVVGTYAGSITVAFDLEIKDLYCTKRADQMPWAYVSGDSTLYLPAGQASKYSFALRPYPFQTLGAFNDTCVVVPDAMTDAELETLGQLIALESTGLTPYGTLTVAHASDFDAKATDANLILVGTHADNAAIAALNDSLSFAYTADGARFADNAQLLLSDDYARDIGVMQMIRSPYFETRAVLVASGTGDATVKQIGTYIKTTENRWKLSGDAVLIDSTMETKSFTFLKEIAQKKATLKQAVEQNKSAILFTVVSTLGMLILVLGAVMVAARAYRRRDRHDKGGTE